MTIKTRIKDISNSGKTRGELCAMIIYLEDALSRAGAAAERHNIDAQRERSVNDVMLAHIENILGGA